LKNWIERACILSKEESMEDIAMRDFGKASDRLTESALAAGLKEARADFERKFIMQKLEEFGGNISRTAQAIGLERSHLHKKIRFYGIESMGN
jgi:two-component system nitrogen regulation response regulator NtrX